MANEVVIKDHFKRIAIEAKADVRYDNPIIDEINIRLDALNDHKEISVLSLQKNGKEIVFRVVYKDGIEWNSITFEGKKDNPDLNSIDLREPNKLTVSHILELLNFDAFFSETVIDTIKMEQIIVTWF